jgi:predicted acylesterase/phospholipase RssA
MARIWQAPASGSLRRIRARAASAILATAVGAALLASGCTTPGRLAAVPAPAETLAQPEIPNVRFYPERDPEDFQRMLDESWQRERAYLHLSPTDRLPPAAYLSISGGGQDGAFAAGLLNGWTDRGDRPIFKLVTGISTGSLIAPFAYLGSKYDPVLRQAYTHVSERDIFTKRPVTAALFDDAMSDTSPMAKLVSHFVTRQLLDQIAAEYAKGRILLIGTTDLDSREPVFWNMGAIATSQSPAALKLFRKIVLASAAIPAAFPPVMIDVTVNGHRYQEMHVDGGATRQVFMYPRRVRLGESTATTSDDRDRSVYIIRNARLDPDWAKTDRRTLSIAARAISALIQTQGMGDMYRMYLTSLRDGLDYNLTFIPADFSATRTSDFDQVYMTKLFERGHEMGLEGTEWLKAPPGYEPGALVRNSTFNVAVHTQASAVAPR